RDIAHISWQDDAMGILDIFVNLSLIVPMIAHRNAINSVAFGELNKNLSSQSEASGRIFSVNNYEIDIKFFSQRREVFFKTPASSFSHDVAKGEDVHYLAKSTNWDSLTTVT